MRRVAPLYWLDLLPSITYHASASLSRVHSLGQRVLRLRTSRARSG